MYASLLIGQQGIFIVGYAFDCYKQQYDNTRVPLRSPSIFAGFVVC